jgi:two-component system alkaline phosphatase synthesis response regulator PhoP
MENMDNGPLSRPAKMLLKSDIPNSQENRVRKRKSQLYAHLQATVLVADGDKYYQESVYRRVDVGQFEFKIVSAYDGEEAIWCIRRLLGSARSLPLMVVSDFHLSMRSGIELCRFVRNHPALTDISFLMTAAEVENHNLCVESLEAGADDFLPKPFSAREFEARLRALKRRVERDDREMNEFPFDRVQIGHLVVDTQKYEVRLHNRPVPLTHKEFLICTVLVSNVGMLVRYDDLLLSVWGKDVEVGRETLKVHMHSLRRKLAGGPLIEAIRGVGYRMKMDA